MAGEDKKAVVHFAGDGLFVGLSPGGHAQVIETDSARASAVSDGAGCSRRRLPQWT